MTYGEFKDESLIEIVSDRRNCLDKSGRLRFSGEIEPTIEIPPPQLQRLIDQGIIELTPSHWVRRAGLHPYHESARYELTDLGYHTLDFLRQKAAQEWRMMQPEYMQSIQQRQVVIDNLMKLIHGE